MGALLPVVLLTSCPTSCARLQVRDSYADRAALVAETPALVALVPRLVGILVVVIDNRLGRCVL